MHKDFQHHSATRRSANSRERRQQTAVGKIKGLSLNLPTLLQDTLYKLQDGIIADLRAREGHMIQVMSEKNTNIKYLSLQRFKLVSQNQQIM